MDQAEFPEGAAIGVVTTEVLGSLPGRLDYLAPAGGCRTGDLVEVPLGPRRVLGVVWGAPEGRIDRARLRPVARVLDVPPMRPGLRDFLTRAADYTLTPLPAMLRLATRAPGLAEGPASRRVLIAGAAEPARMTDARARVLDALAAWGGAPVTLAELAAEAGVSAGVVRGLVTAGAIVEVEAPRDAA
ncbi:MAG: primosomal protein N', partial [Rhodobacterales bacterium]|nr:primosomal protein N' [Rhodobacterales bacterium]